MVPLCGIGGVGGDFVGDDAVFHVFFVGQAEVFLGFRKRGIAEHRAAGGPCGSHPADHGGTDAAGDVVVAGGDVGGERSERVERGFAHHSSCSAMFPRSCAWARGPMARAARTLRS